MQVQSDRRNNAPRFIVENIVLPILIATVTGVGSSYLATRIALTVLETKFGYFEKEVVDQREILKGVRGLQIELQYATRALQKLETIETQIQSLDHRVSRLEK